jgi:hypothetical protein
MGIVLMIHSLVRWAIVLVAIVGIVWYAIGLLQKKSWDKMANGISKGFSGLMDLQGLLGLIYFLWSGIALSIWPRYRFEHLILMFVAIFVSHLPTRLKAETDAIKYRNGLLVIVGVLLLVVVAILPLPGNRWDFSQ